MTDNPEESSGANQLTKTPDFFKTVEAVYSICKLKLFFLMEKDTLRYSKESTIFFNFCIEAPGQGKSENRGVAWNGAPQQGLPVFLSVKPNDRIVRGLFKIFPVPVF